MKRNSTRTNGVLQNFQASLFFVLFFSTLALSGMLAIPPALGQPGMEALPVKPIPKKIADLEKSGADFHFARPFSSAISPETLPTSEEIRRASIGLAPDYSALSSIQQSRPEYLDIEMPGLSGKHLKLRLFKADIGTGGMQIRVSSGKAFGKHQGVFYRGVILGDYESLAAISIFPDHIRGFISSDDGNLVLGPMQEPKGGSAHILYDDRVLPSREGIFCNTGEGLEAAARYPPSMLRQARASGPAVVRDYLVGG